MSRTAALMGLLVVAPGAAGCGLFGIGGDPAPDAALDARDATPPGPCGAEGQRCCRAPGVPNCDDRSLLCAYFNGNDSTYTRFNDTCIPGEGAPCFQDTHCTRWNARAVCRYVPAPGRCTLPPDPCGGHGEACCPGATADVCTAAVDQCRSGRCCAPSEGTACARDADCCTGYCGRYPDGTGVCQPCVLSPAGHACRGPVAPAPDAPCAFTTCPAAYDCRYPQRGVTARSAMCCHDGAGRVGDPGASAACWTVSPAGCNPEGGVEADPGFDQGICHATGAIACAWPRGSVACPALWIVRVSDGTHVYTNGCCYADAAGAPVCGVIATPGCGPAGPGDVPAP